MKRMSCLLNVALFTSIMVLPLGCAGTEGTVPDGEAPTSRGEAPASRGNAGSSGKMDMDHQPSAEAVAALAQLSDEDRAIAEKQVNCPVSKQPLGGMGVPVKVTVKGRVVFLCCEGCTEAVKDNPDKYLADLPK